MPRDRSYEEEEDDYDRPRRKPKRQEDEWETVEEEEFEVVEEDPPPRRRYRKEDYEEEYDPPRPRKRFRSRRRPQINTYMWQSILATLFCCLPLGIVAIIKSSQVNSLVSAGRYKAARRASEEAWQYVMYSVIAGIIFTVLYFVVVYALQ